MSLGERIKVHALVTFIVTITVVGVFVLIDLTVHALAPVYATTPTPEVTRAVTATPWVVTPVPTPSPQPTWVASQWTLLYHSNSPTSVWRFIDPQADVVCWMLQTGQGGGLSCLPRGQTNIAR